MWVTTTLEGTSSLKPRVVKVKQILLDRNSFCIHLTPSEKVHLRVVHQQYEQELGALWQTRRIPLSPPPSSQVHLSHKTVTDGQSWTFCVYELCLLSHCLLSTSLITKAGLSLFVQHVVYFFTICITSSSHMRW